MSATRALFEQARGLSVMREIDVDDADDASAEKIAQLRNTSVAQLSANLIQSVGALCEQYDAHMMRCAILEAQIVHHAASAILEAEAAGSPEAAKDAQQKAKSDEKGLIAKKIQGIKDFIKGLWTKIVNFFKNIIQKAKDMWANYEKFGKAHVSTDFSGIKGDKIKGFTYPGIDSVGKIIAKYVKYINGISDFVKNASGEITADTLIAKLGVKDTGSISQSIANEVRGTEGEVEITPAMASNAAKILSTSNNAIKAFQELMKGSEKVIKEMSNLLSRAANDEKTKAQTAAIRIAAPVLAQLGTGGSSLIMEFIRHQYAILSAAVRQKKKNSKASK
jgi:hypothetical protein